MKCAKRILLYMFLAGAAAAPGDAFAGAPRLSAKGTVPHLFVPASRAQTLYDQTGGDSEVGMNSQNFEAEFDAYDDQAADDFVVPEGTRWKVTEVDVIGNYYDGEGDADSMNVVFYKDKHGKPGRIVAEFNNLLDPGDGWGTFAFDLGKGVRLRPGHYWMSVQANQVFRLNGEWEWESSDDFSNIPAMWRNPGGGFEPACMNWKPEKICFPDGAGTDHLFALKGRVI